MRTFDNLEDANLVINAIFQHMHNLSFSVGYADMEERFVLQNLESEFENTVNNSSCDIKKICKSYNQIGEKLQDQLKSRAKAKDEYEFDGRFEIKWQKICDLLTESRVMVEL